MRIEYDPDVGMAYVCIADTIGHGEAVKTEALILDCGLVNLDFDAECRLIGIECNAERLPESVLPKPGEDGYLKGGSSA
jgi:uncharacterized protein YuzE